MCWLPKCPSVSTAVLPSAEVRQHWSASRAFTMGDERVSQKLRPYFPSNIQGRWGDKTECERS
jgi:hypothetical protein